MTEALTKAENRYSGIPTIRRAMRAHGLPEPKFENRRNEFVVTLYNGRAPQSDALIKAGFIPVLPQDLLRFCLAPRSRKEIADYLGIKTVFYVMQQYVQPLLSSGQLEMTIPDKPKSRNQRYRTVQN